MSQAPQNLDPKEREKLNKIVKHEKRTEHIFRLVLHTIEQIIAAIAIIAVSTTFLVFAVSGMVTQFIMKKKEGNGNG